MNDETALPDSRSILDARTNMDELRTSALAASRAITGTFARGVIEGKRFDEVLRNMSRRLLQGTLKSALAPIQTGISELLNTALKALFNGFNASGAVSGGGGLGQMFSSQATPLAQGGVINEPSFFGVGHNLGLMGERGAEAILPLARGPDGRLGVSAGGGAGGGVANITINIAASDVESFRRSEGQVAATIARAVARGNRGL
jgi:phage-related minor tail protein